jgi:hypothetical protein
MAGKSIAYPTLMYLKVMPRTEAASTTAYIIVPHLPPPSHTRHLTPHGTTSFSRCICLLCLRCMCLRLSMHATSTTDATLPRTLDFQICLLCCLGVWTWPQPPMPDCRPPQVSRAAGNASSPKTRFISTERFLKVMQKQTGARGMDAFAARWVYGRGCPRFELGVLYHSARNA